MESEWIAVTRITKESCLWKRRGKRVGRAEERDTTTVSISLSHSNKRNTLNTEGSKQKGQHTEANTLRGRGSTAAPSRESSGFRHALTDAYCLVPSDP